MSIRRHFGFVFIWVMGLLLLYPLWQWFISRVEVEPGTFLIVTTRWGKELPEGAIVAPDSSYKGIQRRVLPEGRHFLNPIFYAYERHSVLKVPEKKCAVLIRQAGVDISEQRKTRGDFVAAASVDFDAQKQLGERGIVAHVLGPGKYRLNPYEYDVEIVPPIEIQSQEVGVKILRWGKEPSQDRQNPYVVNEGERGVQKNIVPSGTHYINPYIVEIVPVDVRAHTVVFDDIEFPSRDGFKIAPRVEVRYKVIPEKAPELFVKLCEDGILYQNDDTLEEQLKNPILQKIVLPLIRGHVRIEGSKHDAREYISNPKDEMAKNGKATNPRELLQEELMAKVKPACAEVGVDLEYVAVGQTQIDGFLEELASQIRDREQARITRKTNDQKVVQFEQEQELKSTEALAQQRQRIIDANTKLEQAKIVAARRIENEKQGLEAELQSAQARLEGAMKRAEAILVQGKAEANVIAENNKAIVAALKTAVDGFRSPDHFAQYQVLVKLSPTLSEIFASDTSDFANLFSTYMTPGTRKLEAALPEPGAAKTAEAGQNSD